MSGHFSATPVRPWVGRFLMLASAIVALGLLYVATPIGATIKDFTDPSAPQVDQPTASAAESDPVPVTPLAAPDADRAELMATSSPSVAAILGSTTYTVASRIGWYTASYTVGGLLVLSPRQIGAIVSLALTTPATLAGTWKLVTQDGSGDLLSPAYSSTSSTFAATVVEGVDVYVDLGTGTVVGIEPTGQKMTAPDSPPGVTQYAPTGR